MKKRRLIGALLLFSSISLFTSCNNKDINKILLNKHVNIDSFVYVDADELKNLHSLNQDFVLFVYSDCSCGGHTDTIIRAFKEFISETNSLIYAIGKKDYEKMPVSLNKDFPSYPNDIKKESKEIPWINFYLDGTLKYKVDYSSKMETKDGLRSIIDKYTYSNGKINLNTLEEYSHADEKFYKFNYSSTTLLDTMIKEDVIIEYSWEKCSDCFAFKEYERKLFESFNGKLYYFEVKHFRDSSNRAELWDKEGSFPYTYKFSSYRGGKVPSFVSYKNGDFEEMSIFRNDVIEDGTIKESYYEELINQTMTQDKIDEYEADKIIDHITRMASK